MFNFLNKKKMPAKFETVKIGGMHCVSCAMTIDNSLEDLPGVSKSQTNYAKGETVVEFDESVINKESIIETIKKAGYSAE